MREYIEQTRFIRSRPSHEWGTVEAIAPPIQDTWLKILGEICVGFLVALGILMVCF